MKGVSHDTSRMSTLLNPIQILLKVILVDCATRNKRYVGDHDNDGRRVSKRRTVGSV